MYALQSPLQGRISDPGGPDNVIGFAGSSFDHESQLHAMRFRCMDPMLGRFISRDPAGYTDGMSLYQYVGSSPFVLVDLFGLQPESLALGREIKNTVRSARVVRRTVDDGAWWNPWDTRTVLSISDPVFRDQPYKGQRTTMGDAIDAELGRRREAHTDAQDRVVAANRQMLSGAQAELRAAYNQLYSPQAVAAGGGAVSAGAAAAPCLITARLQKHVDDAVRQVDELGDAAFTGAQLKAQQKQSLFSVFPSM